jgi:hypothetical protein
MPSSIFAGGALGYGLTSAAPEGAARLGKRSREEVGQQSVQTVVLVRVGDGVRLGVGVLTVGVNVRVGVRVAVAVLVLV